MGRVMADQAFEAVVAAHHAEIHRYLARVTRRPAEADDLSQETFLRAFRAHGALAPGANVRAWLFAIATNLCRNHWRTEARRRRAHEAIGSRREREDASGPEGEAVLEQANLKVTEIVAALPLKQHLAFTMRKIHDLDYDAIGQSLDCSAESARAHVFQALRKIRRGLGELAIAQAGTGEPRA
jgi:RNA polymerase sigma-70 factor (ECF subfamily)